MFEHSIKVPRLYKTAAKLAMRVKQNGESVKQLVYDQKHANIKALYALIVQTLERESQLEFLLKKSELFTKETQLDPWLAKILITELLWGKQRLSGDSKPVKTILAYHQIFKAHSNDIYDQPKVPVDNKVKKLRFVRINTIKITIEEVIDGFIDEGWNFIRFADNTDYKGFLQKISNLNEDEFMIDIHINNLLIFPTNTQFYKHYAYRNSLIILQDKASCLPVHLLNPPPGAHVMDMCAAPGMKTTQIASVMNNEGTVYAVEMDLKRLQTLDQLVAAAGATCIKTVGKDVLTVRGEEYKEIEYVLVDPSCSGSGIVDRFELEDTKNNDYRLEKLSRFQKKILRHALEQFPAVKRVVYSTCSLNVKENEEVVRDVISSNANFKLVPVENKLNGTWLNFGGEEFGDLGRYCLYARPEIDLTNGFFVAVFERLSDGEENCFFEKSYHEDNGFGWKKDRGFGRRSQRYERNHHVNDDGNYNEQDNGVFPEGNIDFSGNSRFRNKNQYEDGYQQNEYVNSDENYNENENYQSELMDENNTGNKLARNKNNTDEETTGEPTSVKKDKNKNSKLDIDLVNSVDNNIEVDIESKDTISKTKKKKKEHKRETIVEDISLNEVVDDKVDDKTNINFENTDI